MYYPEVLNHLLFQSTHSRRVRPIAATSASFLVRFQSTHSRRVRLKTFNFNQMSIAISIHALKKSATFRRTSLRAIILISIHALKKSATGPIAFKSPFKMISIHALKKSATKEEGKHVYREIISIHALKKSATDAVKARKQAEKISIHALKKSATILHAQSRSSTRYFNPRTQEECDQLNKVTSLCKMIFQSTHSRRVRRHKGGLS